MMIAQFLLRQLNELRQLATLCDLDLLSGEGDSFPVHHVVFVCLNQKHFELARRRGDAESLGHGGKRRMLLSQLTTQELDELVQFMYGKLISQRSRYEVLERALEKLSMSYLLKEAGRFTLEPDTTAIVKSELGEEPVTAAGTVTGQTSGDKGPVAKAGTGSSQTTDDKGPVSSRRCSSSLEATSACMSPCDMHAEVASNEISVSVDTKGNISTLVEVKREQDSSELVSMESRNLNEERNTNANCEVQNQSSNTATTASNRIEKSLSPTELNVDPVAMDINADVVKKETENEKQQPAPETETINQVLSGTSVDSLNESMDDDCDHEMALIDELVHELADTKTDDARENLQTEPRRDCISCNHDSPTTQSNEAMDTSIQEETTSTDLSVPDQNNVDNDRRVVISVQEFDYETFEKHITEKVNMVLSATGSISKMLSNLVGTRKSVAEPDQATDSTKTHLNDSSPASSWFKTIQQSEANMHEVTSLSKKLRGVSYANESSRDIINQKADQCNADTSVPDRQVGKGGDRNLFETIAETNIPLTADKQVDRVGNDGSRTLFETTVETDVPMAENPGPVDLLNKALPLNGKALFDKTAVCVVEDLATPSIAVQNVGNAATVSNTLSNVAVIIPAHLAGKFSTDSNSPFKETIQSKAGVSSGKNRKLLPKPGPGTVTTITTIGSNASVSTLSDSASIALGVLSESVSREKKIKCTKRRSKDPNKTSKSRTQGVNVQPESHRQKVTSAEGTDKADTNTDSLAQDVNAVVESCRQKVTCAKGANKKADKTSGPLALGVSAKTDSCGRKISCAEGMDTADIGITEAVDAYDATGDTCIQVVPSNNNVKKPSSESSMMEQLLFNKTTEVAGYPVLKKMLSPLAVKVKSTMAATHPPSPAEQWTDREGVAGNECLLPELPSSENHHEDNPNRCCDLSSEPSTVSKEIVTQKRYGDAEILGKLQSLLPPSTSCYKPSSHEAVVKRTSDSIASFSGNLTVDSTVSPVSHLAMDSKTNKDFVTQRQGGNTSDIGRLPSVLPPLTSSDVRKSNKTMSRPLPPSAHFIHDYTVNGNVVTGIASLVTDSTSYPEKKRKRHSSVGSSRVKKQSTSKRRRSIEAIQSSQVVEKLAPIAEKANIASNDVWIMDDSTGYPVLEFVHDKQSPDDKIKQSQDNKSKQSWDDKIKQSLNDRIEQSQDNKMKASLDDRMKYLPKESYDTDEDESLPLAAHLKKTDVSKTCTDSSKLTGACVYDGDVTIEYMEDDNVFESFSTSANVENTSQRQKEDSDMLCAPTQQYISDGNQPTSTGLFKEGNQTKTIAEDAGQLVDLTVEGNSNDISSVESQNIVSSEIRCSGSQQLICPSLSMTGSSNVSHKSPVMRNATSSEAVRSPELAKLLSASVKMAKVKTRVGGDKKTRNPRKKSTAKAKHMSFQPRSQTVNASKGIEMQNSKSKFRAIYPKATYNFNMVAAVRMPGAEIGAAPLKPGLACELFQVNNASTARQIAFVNTNSDVKMQPQTSEVSGKDQKAPDRNQEILEIPRKVHAASGKVLETPWKRHDSSGKVEVSDIEENTPKTIQIQKTPLTFHQTQGSIQVTPTSYEGPVMKENTIRGVPFKFSPKTPADQFPAVQKIKMKKRILGPQRHAVSQARTAQRNVIKQQAFPVATPPTCTQQIKHETMSENTENVPSVQCPLDLPVLSKKTFKKNIVEQND